MTQLDVENFAGAVLAGGLSTRMGSDKAFLEIAGSPILSRTLTALNLAGVGRITVVGGNRKRIKSLGHSFLKDEYPQEGPFGALLTSLGWGLRESATHVVVLACDMPNISEKSVKILLEKALLSPEFLILPVLNQKPQWMHACWPVSFYSLLLREFKNGERALWRAIDKTSVPVLEVSDIEPQLLLDIDFREDFERYIK